MMPADTLRPEFSRHRPAIAGTIGTLLGAAVFVAALVSLSLTRQGGGIAAIWTADAMVLAAVLLLPPRMAPLLLGVGVFGIFLANLVVDEAVLVALGLAICSIAGITLAAALFRRFAMEHSEGRFTGFSSARELLGFVALCGGLAPIVSASLASGLLWFTRGTSVATVLPGWFLADALGIVVITPLLLSIGVADAKALLGKVRVGEAALLLGASTAVASVALAQDEIPLLFLLFPAAILPAFRLGFAGTALVCVMVSAIAITGTLLDHGPLMLIGDDATERVVILQLFLLSLNLTVLPIASALTARRTAEGCLLQVSNLQKAILDGADHAIIAIGTDGRITHFNAGASRMLGYAPDEVIGRAMPNLFHLETEIGERAAGLSAELGQRIPSDSTIAAAQGNRRPDERDRTYVRKDGTRLPVHLSVTTLRDSAGAVTGYLGIAKDITEQLRYEETLRQSRRDLQSVIDNIPAMIAYWDKDLHNRFCNRAYIEWFGKSPDQIMTGMHIREVIGERLYALNRPYIEGALRGERQSFEREIPIPTGERRQTQAHYVPSFRDGKIDGFFVLVFDISSLKHTEAALQQAKEAAESATRAKSTFLSRMSHELRTPMNSIIGFTELMQTGQPGPLNERQVEYLELVHFSAEHLLHLIDDILELTRIEAGKLKIDAEPVAVAPLLLSVVASLMPLARKHGIEIREPSIGPDLPNVTADATRAAEALLNLGSNAIKYNHAGGYVAFSAETIPGGFVRLKVEDNGIGIPEEQQPGLFQEFNRLGAEQTAIDGTGIGLALTKRLVEMMHGAISFTSTPGAGSTFWVDLPVERRKSHPA